jgi:hypothetical protein
VTPFEWASGHIHVIGWPALILLCWKVSRFVTRLEGRAVAAETHIVTMATNHFPHMEASLANQDTLLKSIDGSLKDHRTEEKIMTNSKWAQVIDRYILEGRTVSGGGGGSKTDQDAAHGQADFMKTLQSAFSSQFGAQTAITSFLNGKLTNMANNPQGFGQEGLAALRTSAIENTGNQYQNALKTTQEQMAAHGGNGGLPSGVEEQIRGQLAGQAAGSLSNQLTGIGVQDAQLKNQNFWQALSGLGSTASIINPLGYAGGSNSAGNAPWPVSLRPAQQPIIQALVASWAGLSPPDSAAP